MTSQQAESLAREAVSLASNTDAPLLLAEAQADLAEVLAIAARSDDAAIAYDAGGRHLGAQGRPRVRSRGASARRSAAAGALSAGPRQRQFT